ncbi:hypothetical protein OC842_004585 [Tilletia horrida]|uniref:Carboxylic ester hydrolase n=1 Tax=Tilletia horrida TaxID=155126 RepID=A0AAN6JJ66_9BASI|nr:hypothetical protein OC842_004585 [Tilletia horrida]
MKVFAALPFLAAHAVIAALAAPPVATIGQGTITGFTNGTTGVDSFLGMPYALPPVRFSRPQPAPDGYGAVTATQFGPACVQPGVPDSQEDCLTINVFRPAGTSASAKLPVSIFIHGGSWVSGSSQQYIGDTFVKDAAAAGKPFILVTHNYRLGIYGYTGGDSYNNEVQKGNATLNAGYWDQRLAQLWVTKNIAAFGGDPSKVTLMGQSAGAFSVGAHLTFKANQDASQRPFRAAIMNSGVQYPVVLPASHSTMSRTYSSLLNYTGCSSLSSSTSLACLRNVSSAALATANAKIIAGGGLVIGLLAVMPVLDGDFLPSSPNKLLKAGQFADVPTLTGDVNDEGTIFAPNNTSTDAIFRIATTVILDSNPLPDPLAIKVLNQVDFLYPDDQTQGSPYVNGPTQVSQGVTNAADPFFPSPPDNQYKRFAALFGDVVFQANRRLLLQNIKSGTPAWSYIVRQIDLGYPLAKGCAHGYDLPYLFGQQPYYASPALYEPLAQRMRKAWASFITDLDPRTAESLNWPQYDATTSKTLYQFQGLNETLVTDSYRQTQIVYLTSDEAATVFSS